MSTSAQMNSLTPQTLDFGPRRASYFDIQEVLQNAPLALEEGE